MPIDTIGSLSSAADNIARPRRGRHGFMAIATLTCLLVIVAMVFHMLQSSMRARRELLIDRDHRQAELLMEAGAARARFKMDTDDAFPGDVWEIPAKEIVDNGSAKVTTSITRGSDSRILQVVAEYPIGRNFPVRCSHTFKCSQPR